jgi:hypothetical protein
MEWIKAKYDRLMLGVFGLIALVLGGIFAMDALSFKKTNFPPRPDVEDKKNFGTTDAAEATLKTATDALAANSEIVEPSFNGRPVELFVSTPLLKKAGSTEAIAILDPSAAAVRPPIENVWLYNNNLDLTRSDIATTDTDGDGFTNEEEFAGKSNPRDDKSTPPAYTKVKFVEKVTDPMTLLLSLAMDETEANIRRTEPAEKAWKKTLKVGEQFAAEADNTEKRFKFASLTKKDEKDVAIVEDLLNNNSKIELVQGQPVQLPSYRAKLISSLSKNDEKTVSLNEEFTFEAAPEQHYKLLAIEDGLAKLETWYGAEGKKETIELQISSAP